MRHYKLRIREVFRPYHRFVIEERKSHWILAWWDVQEQYRTLAEAEDALPGYHDRQMRARERMEGV